MFIYIYICMFNIFIYLRILLGEITTARPFEKKARLQDLTAQRAQGFARGEVEGLVVPRAAHHAPAPGPRGPRGAWGKGEMLGV